MFRLSTKLDNVRRNVKPWNKRYFGDIFKIKKDMEGKLENLQKVMGDGSASDNMII